MNKLDMIKASTSPKIVTILSNADATNASGAVKIPFDKKTNKLSRTPRPPGAPGVMNPTSQAAVYKKTHVEIDIFICKTSFVTMYVIKPIPRKNMIYNNSGLI